MREFLIQKRDREEKKAAARKRVREEKKEGEARFMRNDDDDDDGEGDDGTSILSPVGQPPRKKFAGIVFEEVDDSSGEDDEMKEAKTKFISFNAALQDRVTRYDVIMPGIAKAFCQVPFLPQNLLIITRGFFAHKTVPATCDKTMNIGTIMTIQNSPKIKDGTYAIFDDLNGKAAILAPEGEIVAVSIAYALAQEGVADAIFDKYLNLPKKRKLLRSATNPEPEPIPQHPPPPEKPLVVVVSVDGDIGLAGLTGQSLFPETDNVFLIHAGSGATMKCIVNLKKFKEHLENKYGSVEAYLAILSVYGGDYVCGINRVTPMVLSDAYFNYAMKDTEAFMKDTCQYFMNKVPDDQTFTLHLKWMQNNPQSLVFLDDTDEYYPLKLNLLFMIGLFVIANIKKAGRGAKFGFFCPCNRGKEGFCEPSVSEDVNLHNLLVAALTVETYLNYLRQQIDLNIKIQVPICATESFPVISGFYRTKSGTIMWGLHPPYEYESPTGYLLFGELEDIEKYEQEQERKRAMEIDDIVQDTIADGVATYDGSNAHDKEEEDE
jgi:hypothetical protein